MSPRIDPTSRAFILHIMPIQVLLILSPVLLFASEIPEAHKSLIIQEWFPRYLAVMGGPLAKIYDIDTTDTESVDRLKSEFGLENIVHVGSLPTVFKNVHISRYKVTTREHKSHHALIADYLYTSNLLRLDTTWPHPEGSFGQGEDYDSVGVQYDTAIDLSRSLATMNELLAAEGPRSYTSEELELIVRLMFECRNFVDEELPLILLDNWRQDIIDIGFNHVYVETKGDSLKANRIFKIYTGVIKLMDEIASYHDLSSLSMKTHQSQSGFDVEAFVYFYGSGFIARIVISFEENKLSILRREVVGRVARPSGAGF